MSVFSPTDARDLAAIAFRYRISPNENAQAGARALVGKEDELLIALRAGEQRYFACRQELQAIRGLRKSDKDLPEACGDLARRLRSIKDDLAKLGDFSRGQLDSIARYRSSTIEEMDAQFENLIQWLTQGAELRACPQPKAPGKKPGVSNFGVLRLPLEEFAKEIRNFLVSPEVRIPFSFEAIPRVDLEGEPRELISAAARLM